MAADSQVLFSNPGDESAVVAAWESFLKGDERAGEALRSLVDASWHARCRPRSTRTPAAARSRWPTATSTCCASASANCWRPARR